MQGWIKDHRQELESDIWAMPPIYHRVWQYIKYMANHHENTIPMRDGTKLKLQPGQHLTSVRTIAQKVGWYERGIFKEPNPKTIQGVIDWLIESNMIEADKSNRKYTLITVVNWAFYQGLEGGEVTESNNVEVTERKQSTDINNNVKKEKKDNTKPSNPKFSISDMENAKLLFELMRENNPGVKEPILEKWAADFRLIRERDKRTDEQIKYLIRWTQKDIFWKSNILSPSKLRKQWDSLVIRIKSEDEKRKNQLAIGQAQQPKTKFLQYANEGE